MFNWMKYFVISGLMCTQTYAFTCYITMVKDSCWTKYNLMVDVADASTGAESVTITVPAGQSWGRQKFECKEGQTLALYAQFDPVFWANDEGRKFPAQRYWKLPDSVESGVTGWNVTVCYPKWFANVPMPPEASSKCQCNTDDIPPVAPIKVDHH